MTQLDEDMLAGIRTSRERKLSNAERLAIFAFHRRGVPVKILAHTFDVTPNAIRYITNYEHTAAHEHAKQMFEQYGEERVWNEVVTAAQTESVNRSMRKTFEGKEINDRGYRRNNRDRVGARRAGTASGLPEATSDETNGGGRAA